LCAGLVKNKDARTLEILDETYGAQDVLFIQEAAVRFRERVQDHKSLNNKFIVLFPENPDTSRDQNSLILVNITFFHPL